MITPAVVSFPACANMSVDEAAVDYWLKELVPTVTQVAASCINSVQSSQAYLYLPRICKRRSASLLFFW